MSDPIGTLGERRTKSCAESVEALIKTHLECMIDSGVPPEGIKAMEKTFTEAIWRASDLALCGLIKQMEGEIENVRKLVNVEPAEKTEEEEEAEAA
jgi:hypothetical protein